MSNVKQFPVVEVDGPTNIPAKLRALADELEARGDVRTCLVVMDVRPGDVPDDNHVDVDCYGYRPMTHEAVGLLDYAKMRQYEVRNG